MIRKDLYDKVFSAVSITKFFPGVIWHWSKEENVNDTTRKKLRRVIKYIIENDLVSSSSEMYRLQFCDGRNLMKAIKKYGGDSWFVRMITCNPNFDEKCAATLLEICRKKDPQGFESEDMWGTRSMILTCEFIPEDELRKYAKSKNMCARADVAANKACPKDVLEELSNDAACTVRTQVARNPATPEDIRLKLADDKSAQVRKWLAFNRTGMTEKIIRKLAKYKDEFEIVRAIVNDPVCPADILEEFASYTHRDPARTYIVRRSVATHPNLSQKGWDILHSDPNPSWANFALASKLCPLELLDTFVPDVKFASDAVYYIMHRDDLTDDVVEMFLNNMGARARAVTIAERDLPQETLLKFYQEKCKVVNHAIAKKLRDNDAIMYLLKENRDNDNEFSYYISLVDGLGEGSAEMFIEYIYGYKPKRWVHFVKSYLGYSRCSESDMWMVFNEFKDCSPEGYKSCNFAEELLKAIANRRNLSDYSLEDYISFALYSEEIENHENALVQLNGTFYTKTMLDMCIDFIRQQSKAK